RHRGRGRRAGELSGPAAEEARCRRTPAQQALGHPRGLLDEIYGGNPPTSGTDVFGGAAC
ncbi:hypothetical protein ACFQZ2_21890, partial [Streptomonospora algeriensis]